MGGGGGTNALESERPGGTTGVIGIGTVTELWLGDCILLDGNRCKLKR